MTDKRDLTQVEDLLIVSMNRALELYKSLKTAYDLINPQDKREGKKKPSLRKKVTK